MMKCASKSVRKRRRNAIPSAVAALSRIASEPWHMAPAEVEATIQTVQSIAKNGFDVTALSSEHKTVQIAGSQAIINVTGMIRPEPDFYTRYLGGTACSDIRAGVRQAISDPNVNTLILICDTPGGSVFGIEETAELIFSARQNLTTIAFNKGQMSSAGYWLGSACERVIGSPSSISGSVGAVQVLFEYSKMLADEGIAVEHIQFGENKTDGSPYKPLEKTAKANLQSMIDSYGKQFVSSVARNRNTTSETVMKQFGQGRVFIASEALERNMIDAVGTLETAVSRPDAMPSVAIQHTQSVETPSAAVVVAETSPRVQTPAKPVTGVSPVKKIKAYAFAVGLLAEDATDEQAAEMLTTYCAAKGVEVPRNGETIDEPKALAILKEPTALVATLEPKVASVAAPNVQAAQDQEIAEAKAAGIKAEQDRIAAINQLADTLNFGTAVAPISTTMVSAAIQNPEVTAETVREKWMKSVEDGPEGQALNPPVVTADADDKFAEMAVNAQLTNIARQKHQAGEDFPMPKEPQGGYGDLRHMNLYHLAKRSLQMSGHKISEFATREEIGKMALQMGSTGRASYFSEHNPMASVPYNRASEFPNLMANLAGKILDAHMALAPVSYDKWCGRVRDTPDFKESTVTAMASFSTLDEVKDGDPYKQQKFGNEFKGQIRVERHGNKVGLTPIMVANDDMDGFQMQLQTLGYAHDNTLNELCVNLLAGNAPYSDGVPLFDATHGNLVTSGGSGPSFDAADAMRILMSEQRGIAQDGQGKRIKCEPVICLVPAHQYKAAQQTFMSIAELSGDLKHAPTDSALNTERQHRIRIVKEVDLADFEGGTSAWYLFASPSMYRVVSYQFQTGYGRGGQRDQWFDNDSRTRWFSLEGRFGASILGYRGVVKNPGV